MRSKGLILASLALVGVIGLLVYRSYRLNEPKASLPDPQRDALPLSALEFHAIDRASYDMGTRDAENATKSTGGTTQRPGDWISYWLGFGEDARTKGNRPAHSAKFPDRLHDDQRCILGEVVTVRGTTYAKAKGPSGTPYLCNGDTVLPTGR